MTLYETAVSYFKGIVENIAMAAYYQCKIFLIIIFKSHSECRVSLKKGGLCEVWKSKFVKKVTLNRTVQGKTLSKHFTSIIFSKRHPARLVFPFSFSYFCDFVTLRKYPVSMHNPVSSS